jgi:primosomal protein N' (replication factor Y)
VESVLLDVLVDAPFDEPLQYRAPERETTAVMRGQLCVVPLGRRAVVGIVTGRSAQARVAAERLKPVTTMLDDPAPLGEDWLAMTQFAAQYYQYPWGEVAINALPPQLRSPPGPRFTASLARLRARRLPPASKAVPPLQLNTAQADAVERVGAVEGFAAWLLHGVTGSGKTEVYCEIVARCFARNPVAQALLLVPEINLTPQFEARLRARFPGVELASLHSGLAAAARSGAWLAAHEGRARIVLGTRSSIFASLPQLAMIVVDEEHDTSFKAGEGVRYSARDLAIKRAQSRGIPVILGSATPSLETWAHAQSGRHRLLTLPQRASVSDASSVPSVRVQTVDVQQTPPVLGLCAPAREALRACMARGEQALVFINRRGYAPVLACGACGWLSACPRCSVFAAFHKSDACLHCHHCGWQAPVPRACPTCGNQALDSVGHGTQRVEEALRELLPQARIARIDRDSTRRRGAASAALAAVHAGEVDVLVGTQMIAKGHDFQRVTLVLVLNADAQLVSHDFRAAERLFATLLQVVGRAGRAGAASVALIQTRYPQHPLYRALQTLDYAGFAAQQLEERRRAHMPPFVHQALLSAEARSMDRALEFLRAVRSRAGSFAGAERVQRYDVVPMTIARRADLDRAQMLFESTSRSALRALLAKCLPEIRLDRELARGVRWQIDVDPLEI